MRLSNLVNRLNPSAPKGLIASADEWVRIRAAAVHQLRHPQPQAWVKEVFAADDHFNLLDYPLPPTPGEEFTSVRWTASGPSRLFYMQGARILGDEGAVISPDNRVFADFTLPPADDWREHACFKRRRIPPVQTLKGWYATVAWPESKFFFHWMIEALPRMAVLGESAEVLDGLFVPSPLQNYHRESLAQLGFGPDKLIPLSPDAHFQPEHLFVPQAFAMYNPPRWVPEWFKRSYLPAPDAPTTTTSPSCKRIYISRADAPMRQVANETAVAAMLARHGFSSVRLSEHAFSEQARIFNDADVIVGPHGAGLSNLVFCREGTTVIEVLPPRWMAPCFMTLAFAARCRYHHLLGSPREGTGNPQRDDIDIPLDELDRLLQTVLAA